METGYLMEFSLVILSVIALFAYSNKLLIFIDLFDIFICFCQFSYFPSINLPKRLRKNSFLAHLRGLFVHYEIGLYVRLKHCYKCYERRWSAFL